MINMAKQLALFLQAKGEGTLGTDLFVDSDSQSHDEAITLCHIGGSAEFKLDAPGSWRKLSLLVRSATAEGAQERIWRLIGRMLEPEEGTIQVDGGLYTVQITSLPAGQTLDAQGRTSMKAVFLLKQIKPVVESWLEAISQFTETALGVQWRVYRGFNGTCRPAVSWQCTGWHSAAASRGVQQLSKQFVGQIAARSASEYQLAAQVLMLGLAEQAKLPLGGLGGRWLTVLGAQAAVRSGDLSTGVLTVTLTGAAGVTPGSSPLIAGVHTEPKI
ncbi:hypothetical protein HZF08_34460 [Paenibacillus sp. CGMCC 1.16610]|nr:MULTISPECIES: minor capsid protein [Paenibacillus]MBA2943376.1 hypothetical protein [Paenibacillus sp. CGMCC 1.16610]